MTIEYYKKYEPIFGTWHIVKQLGEGSFGKVYEVKREDYGETYRSALKAITVPQSESEIKSVMYDGMDEDSARKYFETFVKDIVSEFVLMSKLKGNSNVVSYEDHLVIPHEGKIGWDILIRMELLTPLMDYAKSTTFTQRDVIKLGIDMCNALETCQKRNIIHRDIKPDNIFVSSDGNFKLGDFGIARTIEKTTSGLSKKGTYTYMAPEVYRGEAYGSAVDIYSLGVVMYRLINKNRTPFMPPYPESITHTDRENALIRRISGETIPAPVGAQGRLVEIILKACSYKTSERYSSPMQMRGELEAIQYSSGEAIDIYPQGDTMSIKSVEYADSNAPHPDVSRHDTTDIDDVTKLLPMESTAMPQNKQNESIDTKPNIKVKKKPLLLIAILVLIIVLSTIFVYFRIYNPNTNPEDYQPFIPDSIVAPTPEISAAPSPTPIPTPTPTPIPSYQTEPVVFTNLHSGWVNLDDLDSDYVFEVSFDVSLDRTYGAYFDGERNYIILWDHNNNEVLWSFKRWHFKDSSRVLSTCNYYVTIYGDVTNTDILIPGNTYTWIGYIILGDLVYETPMQSFVFSYEGTHLASTNEQSVEGVISFECANFESEVRWHLRKPEGESILISDVAYIVNFMAIDREITSIAGIEHFKSLQELTVNQNNIRRLDMRHNPELRGLFFWGNQVEFIDVSQNPHLRTLVAQSNRLTSLDLSNNPELIEVFCDWNQLTMLDVTANPKIYQLACNNNQLTALDLRNNPLLELLFVDGNRIRSENDILGLNELTLLDRNNHDKYRFSPQNR
jgi:serine/threonine protein kinase